MVHVEDIDIMTTMVKLFICQRNVRFKFGQTV